MEEEMTVPERRTKRSARKRRDPRPRQHVNYTQPKPFFRRKFLLRLLAVAAVALAIAVGVSVFFKVDTVTVAGASKYSAATVAEASGIEKGDSLLFFGRGSAAARISSKLPYVASVRFELKLPGTVNIIVEEKPVSYALEAEDGTWWCITSDGKVAEALSPDASDTPIVTGVKLREPTVGKKAIALEPEGDETQTATQAEHLQAAVKILLQLEKWELFSCVESIDVSDLYALRMNCTDDRRVELGSGESLEKKMGMVKATMLELDEKSYGAAVLKLFYEDEKWQIQCSPASAE